MKRTHQKFSVVRGGVTTAKGFLANALYSGIKKSGRKDLALLYSVSPAVASAAFTTNAFVSSSIELTREHLRSKTTRALIVNSGNANCAVGRTGYGDARLMARLAARELGIEPVEVLVASTGVIGKRMPIDSVSKAIPELARGLDRGKGGVFAEAILTTDTRKRESCVRLEIGGKEVTIGGTAKGAGMIYPELKTENHATLLSFITTDADISKGLLDEALEEAIGQSFNMISVDGDMSTNDTVLAFANGLAGNERISGKGSDFENFKAGLDYVMGELARMVVRDGEGATKFIEVKVKGARSMADARRIARKVTTSNLLKTCVHGGDPNWGRIIASAGSSAVAFRPEKVDVYLGGIKVVSAGARFEKAAAKRLKDVFMKKDVAITVDLKSGRGEAIAWTCDLSKEYVNINAEYST
jgi:glutamate N-acetyltransferase/amino-acid N-acetyltransferase